MSIFKNLHPATQAFYYVSAILLSMIFMRPAFCLSALVLSFLSAFCADSKRAVTGLKLSVPFALLITFVNPLFNKGGETVIFKLWRINYTLESLLYGSILACMFVTGINLFFCMGKVLDSDRITFLFASKFASVCAVLNMALSLIPVFLEKFRDIYRAQKLLKEGQSRTKTAFSCFDCALSYAFERAVNMTFSMKNRGFGATKATRYKKYRFTAVDFSLVIFTAFADAFILFFCSGEAGAVDIIPKINFLPLSPVAFLGLCLFICLLATPAFFYIFEEVKWKYLKSKI